jgi:hypothetical protein
MYAVGVGLAAAGVSIIDWAGGGEASFGGLCLTRVEVLLRSSKTKGYSSEQGMKPVSVVSAMALLSLIANPIFFTNCSNPSFVCDPVVAE